MGVRQSRLVALSVLVLSGCATVAPPPVVTAPPIPQSEQVRAQTEAAAPKAKVLKRKVAIGRFSNETRYGRTFFTDQNLDPLGKQASDMLASRLVASNKFLVFERQDLNKIREEQAITKQADLIGVDALILGSVTEFGRSITGTSGFLSGTKVQTARAKVDIRLVDARTGFVFFSATGSGEASTESGEVAGFGSKADYDATLNDRAIAAAIADVQGALMNKLEERPWRTDILKVDGGKVFISGGAKQGLNPGALLQVMEEGDKVKSGQTGFEITLPPTPVGQIRVLSLFGDNESNEGAIAELISGRAVAKGKPVYIAEGQKQ